MKDKRKGRTPANQLINAAKAAGLEIEVKGINLDSIIASANPAPTCFDNDMLATVKWSDLPPEAFSEEMWQARVVTFATEHGWTCYHTHDSRGSDPGFHDLFMAKASINTGEVWLYIAELKTETGVESKEQKKWSALLANFQALKPCRFRDYLWRPSHWDKVQQILSEPME